jgi:broad specificity phosphatase PhoE
MRRAVARCGDFDRIVTSPLRRCTDFARALAESRGVPLVIETGFREMHFGLWEGKTVHALMAMCPHTLRQFWADPLAHPPPVGEPLDRFCTRVVAAWRAQLRAPGGRRLLLIVHGGTIRAILGHLRGLSAQELICLDVPYAGVHAVEVGPNGDAAELEWPASDA